MRKHRVEIAIGSFFVILLIALMWQILAIQAFPFLPHVLIGVVGAILLAVIVDALAVHPSGSEKYAPVHFAKVFVTSIVGIAVMVGLTMVLHRPSFSKTFDLSEGSVHSLSTETEKVLKNLKTEMQIVCVPEANPRDNYCQDTEHLRQLYTQTNAEFVTTFNLNLADRSLVTAVNPTGFGRLILLTKDGKRKELEGRVDESKLTNGIINLVNRNKVVHFLTGYGEPGVSGMGERSYSTLVELLKARGYEAVEYDPNHGSLPAEAEVLVAGSNTIPYPTMVEEILRKHLAHGGRLILSAFPYREMGLSGLLKELGVTLEDKLLIGNDGATPMGQRWQQANPLRPPVSVGMFSRLSDITSQFGVNVRLPVSGAIPIKATNQEGEIKTRVTKLMDVMDAAPVAITAAERNRLPENGPLGVNPEPNFDLSALYPVAYEITVENYEKLDKNAPAKTEDANNKDEKNDDAKKDKDTKIILVGFDLSTARYIYPPDLGVQVQLPLLAVSDLYQDKELVAVPTKDFKPKAFRMDRNPQKYLLMFAFLLPALTIVAGIYIWSRRRLS